MRKALYILGQLNDHDIEWMLTVGSRLPTPRDTILIKQGEALQSMFIVLDGSFAVTDKRMAGRELARLGSGEILGEMSFIDSAPPAATVTALADGAVLALPRTALLEKLERDTAFAARFYRAMAIFLADRLRATVGRLGYGAVAEEVRENEVQADELDLNVLDTMHLAGDRFERMVKRFARA